MKSSNISANIKNCKLGNKNEFIIKIVISKIFLLQKSQPLFIIIILLLFYNIDHLISIIILRFIVILLSIFSINLVDSS